jgi:hypothetical protein
MGEAFLYLPHTQYMHHLCKNLHLQQTEAKAEGLKEQWVDGHACRCFGPATYYGEYPK